MLNTKNPKYYQRRNINFVFCWHNKIILIYWIKVFLAKMNLFTDVLNSQWLFYIMLKAIPYFKVQYEWISNFPYLFIHPSYSLHYIFVLDSSSEEQLMLTRLKCTSTSNGLIDKVITLVKFYICLFFYIHKKDL